jgi:hypothetical protein
MYIAHIHMCIVGFMTPSKGLGGGGGREQIILRNCNLLQHDDEPLDGYLGPLCCPQSLIKWYGFDSKTKR